MHLENLNSRGLLLIGCGRMGSALLEGWLQAGVQKQAITIIDPSPSDGLKSLAAEGLNLNGPLPDSPAALVLAVKPQMMKDVLPGVKTGEQTACISIAAGTRISVLEAALGAGTPIIRTMPNTPAAIGSGITALIGNGAAADMLDLARFLMEAVGETVLLETEEQMDAVTALSGSGPAYVFYFAEAMARAGQDLGLGPEIAGRLANATVAGAGKLMAASELPPARLRENVTSPGGTTQAALTHLMQGDGPFNRAVSDAMTAAFNRSKEL